MLAQRRGPLALQRREQRGVVGGEPAARSTCGSSWSRNSRISPPSAAWAAAIRGLSAAATIAACSAGCASVTSLHAGAAGTGALSARQRLVDGGRQRPPWRSSARCAASSSSAPQLVEPAHLARALRRATRAPRLGSIRTSPSAGERPQRGAQRVARHAVARRTAPARPAACRPGRSPSRISRAQRGGERVDRRHPLAARSCQLHARPARGRRRGARARRARPGRRARAPAPSAAARAGRSARTITPSSAAVSGSASVSVEVSAADRRRRPRANST